MGKGSNKKELESELSDIEKLISTPTQIRDIALGVLSGLNTSNLGFFEKQKFANGKQALENISQESLSKAFNVIYNQVCVLAVSALSVALEKYFTNYLNSNWSSLPWDKSKELSSIKIDLAELAEMKFQVREKLAQIILSKNNSINFQDLGSTLRSFDNYLGREIKLEEIDKGNAIFYMQCRHVIVHNNGIIDESFLKKVGIYNKKNYAIRGRINLTHEDWLCIRDTFLRLIDAAAHACIRNQPTEAENTDALIQSTPSF